MAVEQLTGRQRAADVVVAVLVAAVGLAEIWVPFESRSGDGSNWVSTAGVLLFATALALRRARPWWSLVGLLVWPILGTVFGASHMHLLFLGQLVPVMILAFTIARHGRGRYLWVASAAVVAFITLADLFVPLLSEPSELIFHWTGIALVWITGRGLRVAADRAAAEAVRAHVAETTSRQQALAAISQERARIARELHDIVAHAVGVIVVQAGAAEQAVEDDPEFTRRALAAIRSTGSDALNEMRRLVGMLREADVDGALAPQPGIASLPELVESVRGSGLDVRLEVTGEAPILPAGLDLTVYRIVQEALTNIRRHSRSTSAEAALDFRDGALEIRVSDDGPARSPEGDAGHGLLGMRERVALYGGDVEAGPDGDGFRVRAVLPLERV